MKIPIYDDYNSVEGSGETIIVEEEKDINKKNRRSDNKVGVYNSNKPQEKNDDVTGKITVISRLNTAEGTLISSAKINLYAIDGISPKLIDTQYSDSNGRVTFNNLKKGSYRVIAIVDRKYFEKPTYLQWNEVTIDKNMRDKTIVVINKIKIKK